MGSIQETSQKIKSRTPFLLIIGATVVCIIIAIFSFILGRISLQHVSAQNDTYIEYPSTIPPYKAEKGGEGASLVQEGIVASKNGTKYYTLDCLGVSKIKEENKIYFVSITEAQNAGYEAAKSCF